ncbi:uncharacterized protein CEXT_724721 [Caerostris extrusa]|uniref:Uncharacterized protein n=1 Tax=Caerostris extrusa TaxID=172846 RepID=A0AAV4QTS6_CAEEX|nr:uncharacterized protein CEXT_724721 [Caerostris extrusa]
MVSKFNKRKQELAERMKERIETEEAIGSIVLDEKTYKHTVKEIQNSFYKFKETDSWDAVFPYMKNIFLEKKEKTVAYLNTFHRFRQRYNDFVNSAKKLKDSQDSAVEEDGVYGKNKTYSPSGPPLDFLHIALLENEECQIKDPHIKIVWNNKDMKDVVMPEDTR